jgi:probable rRNA maturation factor
MIERLKKKKKRKLEGKRERTPNGEAVRRGKAGLEIKVREENAALPISTEVLYRLAQHAFDILGKEPAEISLLVCNDDFIFSLNKRYRCTSESTDVLSFSMREGDFSDDSSPILGDIVISIETTKKQARVKGRTLEEEFLLLFTHGLLHLLGFRHNNDWDKRTMNRTTEKILAGVS